MSGATTANSTTVQPKLVEPGDADRFSHYVVKEEITRAAVTGEPATAICGKSWTPTRNGEDFPVCADCQYLYDNVVGTGPGAQS